MTPKKNIKSDQGTMKGAIIKIAVGIFVGIVVLIAGGVIKDKWFTERAQLCYTGNYTSTSASDDQKSVIYNVIISNTGELSVPDVIGYMRVPSATLANIVVNADPTIKQNNTILGDSLVINIDELNPNDTVIISVRASSSTTLPSSPEIHLRGKGVTGVSLTSAEIRTLKGPPLIVMIIQTIIGTMLLVATIVLIVLTARIDDKNERKKKLAPKRQNSLSK
jgi:hypothetical protein